MQKTTESTIAIFVLAILYLFALPAQAQYNGDGWQRLMYSSGDGIS